jgi:hypothetical protein
MAATLGDPIPISQSSSTVQPRTAPQSARAPLPYRRCTDEYGGIEYGGRAGYEGWFVVWPVSALWAWSMVAAQLASRFSPS